MNNVTEAFVTAARADDDFARAVRETAAGLLDEGEAYVDSSRLHDARPDLGLTYVQFVLRETPYLCRHTIGDGRYRVHAQEQCGADCGVKFAQRAPVIYASRRCPTCFLSSPPAVDECPACDSRMAA